MEHCKNCSKMHRRAQKAESEVIKLRKQLEQISKPIDPWAGSKRQAEAIERDRMAEVIERYK